jgi:hypothetical protein
VLIVVVSLVFLASGTIKERHWPEVADEATKGRTVP